MFNLKRIKVPQLYPLAALMTLLPVTSLTTDKITRCANEAAKDANTGPRNPPFCFFISCFAVSVIPSISEYLSYLHSR